MTVTQLLYLNQFYIRSICYILSCSPVSAKQVTPTLLSISAHFSLCAPHKINNSTSYLAPWQLQEGMLLCGEHPFRYKILSWCRGHQSKWGKQDQYSFLLIFVLTIFCCFIYNHPMLSFPTLLVMITKCKVTWQNKNEVGDSQSGTSCSRIAQCYQLDHSLSSGQVQPKLSIKSSTG